MKKKLIIFSLFILLLFPMNANAQGLSLKVDKDKINTSDILNIDIYSDTSFASMTLNFEFDSEKFEVISAKSLYGEEVNNVEEDSVTSIIISMDKNISGKFYNIKLKAKENTSYDKTTIKVKTSDCYKEDGLTSIKMKSDSKDIVISSNKIVKSFFGRILFTIKNSLILKIVILLIIFIILGLIIYKKKKRY